MLTKTAAAPRSSGTLTRAETGVAVLPRAGERLGVNENSFAFDVASGEIGFGAESNPDRIQLNCRPVGRSRRTARSHCGIEPHAFPVS